ILDGRETLNVTPTQDPNTSPPTTTLLNHQTPPHPPTLHHLSTHHKTVEPTARPNSILTLHFPNRTSVESHPGKHPPYNPQIPTDLKLKPRQKITPTPKHIDANLSQQPSTTVQHNT
ncbi:hypothetical protein, partial [Staphylococcus pettenkoferi]|uniref:hypothetical protein n=1 Tax=Staphylococcus pettenkoferi TaxID=170573 RepID=UPI001C92C96D